MIRVPRPLLAVLALVSFVLFVAGIVDGDGSVIFLAACATFSAGVAALRD